MQMGIPKSTQECLSPRSCRSIAFAVLPHGNAGHATKWQLGCIMAGCTSILGRQRQTGHLLGVVP